jgi:peptidoglycan/xylan/chitin deacetylase (PgdA/CDA1 family)
MSILSRTQALLGAGIPVLCYHQVRPDSGMTPQKFGRHLDILSNLGFQTISLANLHRIILGQKQTKKPSVVITFDDCTLDNWIYAVPELLRRDMRGVFFAITDFVRPGQPRLRADQTEQPDAVPVFGDIMRQALSGNCGGFMNQDELRALVHELGMEVFSHSGAHQACFTRSDQVGVLGDNAHWSHEALCGPESAPGAPVYPVGSAYAQTGFGLSWDGRPQAVTTDSDRLAFCFKDFAASKKKLESLLAQPCPFLCLPWGEHDEVTLEAAEKAGYHGVLNLKAGYVGPGIDPMRIGRLAVKDRKNLAWLGLKALLLAHRPLAPWVKGRNIGRQQ